MTKDESLRLALEAIEDLGMKHYESTGEILYKETYATIKDTLEAKDEPVAAECKFDQEKEWGRCSVEHHNLVQSEPNKWPGYQTRLLYATPPQRTWVGLTDEDWFELAKAQHGWGDLLIAAEAKLRSKNT